MRKMMNVVITLCLVLAVSSLAVGDVVTGTSYIDGVAVAGGVGVGYSSTWAGEVAWSPIYTVDGSGLDASTGTIADSATGNAWFAGGGAPQWIIYDLGASYSLQALRVWNYSRTSEPDWRQMKDVNVYVSATNQAVGDPAWGTANAITLAHITPSTTVDISDTKPLVATGQYVLFEITSCWPQGGWEMPGMSEIRFQAVPEPATMVLLGLGSLFLARRRRA